MRNPENIIGIVKDHSVQFGLIGDFIPCAIPGVAHKMSGVMFTQDGEDIKLMIHNNGGVVEFDQATAIVKTMAVLAILDAFKGISQFMVSVYDILEN
jgi:hypothetical protein